ERRPALDEFDDRVRFNRNAGDEDALAKIDEVWRRVLSHAQSAAAQQCFGRRERATLPVRSGDVEYRIRAVWIPKHLEQGIGALEAELVDAGCSREEEVERFLQRGYACAQPSAAGRPDI